MDIRIGLGFGLACGFVEAAGLYFHINPTRGLWTSDALYIVPAFDMLLFVAIGIVLTIVRRVLGTTRDWCSSSLFVFLTIYNWVALLAFPGIRHIAILILSLGVTSVFHRRYRTRELGVFSTRSLAFAAAVPVLLWVGIQGSLALQELRAEASLTATQPGSPNILIIIVDALRADHLSSYGYKRMTSPNLDQLAREGVLFENAIATASWSLPSHVSILTGRFPYEHGAQKEEDTFDGGSPLISEYLQERGYRTAGFSANVGYFSRRAGLGRGFIHFENYSVTLIDIWARTIYGQEFNYFLSRLGSVDVQPGRWRAKDMVPTIVKWIDRDHSRPFLCVINFLDVHSPYGAPPPFRGRFSGIEAKNYQVKTAIGIQQGILGQQATNQIDEYDEGIAYADDQIHHLLIALEQRAYRDNTLVIITADHGESFGEHGLFTHAQALYLELIHVPLIFVWPKHIPAKLRIDVPVSLAAIPGTVARLVEGNPNGRFPGPQLNELWMGTPRQSWPYPLSELAEMPILANIDAPARYGALRSLLTERWHYIIHEKFGSQLYDWRSDPKELSDLTGTPEGRILTRDFAIQLKTFARSR